MHHIVTLDRLARYRVEERLHEAEHEAHLRRAREAAAAAGRPTGGAGRFRRLVRMVVALAVAAIGVRRWARSGTSDGCFRW